MDAREQCLPPLFCLLYKLRFVTCDSQMRMPYLAVGSLGSCGIQEAAGKPQPRGFQGLVPPRLSHTASSRSSIYCISEAPQNPQCNISEAGHGAVALFWWFQWFCNSSGLLTPFLLFSHRFLFLILEITSKTLYSLGGREWVEWSHLLVIPPVIPLWDLNTFTFFFFETWSEIL